MYSAVIKNKWVMTFNREEPYPRLCFSDSEENKYYFEIFEYEEKEFEEKKEIEEECGFYPILYEHNGDKFYIFISKNIGKYVYPFLRWSYDFQEKLIRNMENRR